MNNTKTTKRALLSSVVAMLVCITMLIGTTFAWFNDSASTAVNKIQAGTLDVQLLDESGNELDPSQALSWKTQDTGDVLWEPNCTYNLDGFKIKNAGNLALKYKIVLKATGITDNNGKTLLDVIDWTIKIGTETLTVTDEEIKAGLGTADGIAIITDRPLLANTDETISVTAHMQSTAGNDYQGLRIDGFGITVYAAQLSSEKDSFDETYDIAAEYPQEAQPSTPTFTVNTAAQLRAALKPTVTESDSAVVNITDDIQLADGETWTPMDLGSYAAGIHKIVINGNGHTISGLNNALIGYCYFGDVAIEIKDLTIANADMTQATTNALGYGAFVLSVDNCASLVLNDCHLKDSIVVALEDVGGLVGFANADTFKLTGCSVENCTITGPESVGGLVGTCGYGDVTFTDCNTIDTNLTSTKSGTYRIGFAIGTVPAGNVTLANVAFRGGSVTQASSTGPYTGATCTELIGRNLGNVTGDNSAQINFQ